MPRVPFPSHAAQPIAPEHAPRVPARPRAWAALGATIAGVLLSRVLPDLSFHVALPIAIALALAAWLTPARAAGLLLLASLCLLSLGWADVRTRTAPAHALDVMLTESPALVRVEGVLLSAPRPRPADDSPLAPPTAREPSCTLDVALRTLHAGSGPVRATGTLRVYVRTPDLAHLRAGDRLEILGNWRAPERARNPGEADWLALARQRGHVGTLGVDNPGVIRTLPHASTADAVLAPVRRVVALAHARAVRALAGDAERSHTTASTRALALALVLGERSDGLEDLRRTFARTGTAHLMAISGYHLVVLALAIALCVRAPGERAWLEKLAVCAGVGLYLVLVPAEAPVLRAGFMVLALAAVGALGRRGDAQTTLAWAGVVLLLWRPLDALSLGWQLTFGVTALLLRLDAGWRAEDRLLGLGTRPWWAGSLRRLQRAVVGSLACWAVGAPLIAGHTGVVSPLAWLAALACTPLIVATMLAGFAAVVVGVVMPAASAFTAPVVLWLSARTHGVVAWAESIPWTWAEVPPLPWWWALAASACALGAVLPSRVRAGSAAHRAFSRRGMCFCGLVLATALVPVLARPGLPRDVLLRVDMLAVGDGTCIVVRSGDEALIWDAGSLRAGTDGWRLARAARALGVRGAPAAVVTHANLDHFNALPELAEALGVRRVLTTPRVLDSVTTHPGVAALLDELSAHGAEIVPISSGHSFALGPARAHVMWPPEDHAAIERDNDASLCVVFRVPTQAGERHVLLVGDAQRVAAAGIERAVRDSLGPTVRPAIMEAPHHGAWNPEAAAMVARLDPAVVLQSTGTRRAADPRWQDIRAARVWRTTAIDGASWAEILCDGRVRVSPAVGQPEAR